MLSTAIVWALDIADAEEETLYRAGRATERHIGWWGDFGPHDAAAEHCFWFTLLRVILSPIGISSFSRGELSSTVLVTRVRRDIASEWVSSGLDCRMRKID